MEREDDQQKQRERIIPVFEQIRCLVILPYSAGLSLG